MKRIALFIGFLLLLLTVCVIGHDLHFEAVDANIPATLYLSNASGEIISGNLVFKGQYRNSSFFPQRYEGSVSFDGYDLEIPENGHLVMEFKDGWAEPLISDTSGQTQTTRLHSFHYSPETGQFMFLLWNHYSSQNNQITVSLDTAQPIFICPDTMTAEEALKLLPFGPASS